MSQNMEISQKSFPAKQLLKQTTYLLLEAKNPSYFNCMHTNYKKEKPRNETQIPTGFGKPVIVKRKALWHNKGDIALSLLRFLLILPRYKEITEKDNQMRLY